MLTDVSLFVSFPRVDIKLYSSVTVLPVLVEIAKVPSFVSSVDEGFKDVLVDTKGPAALDVS